MTRLLIRGGTVATTTGSRRADVAVEGGRIAALEPAFGERWSSGADEIVDASGLLVLPGVVGVQTHTRVASDQVPDRLFEDSAAAAFGGTTTLLAFNNPGTGASEAAALSLTAGLAEWRSRTAGDSAVDYAASLAVTGGMDDPVAELPAVGTPGSRRPRPSWSSTFASTIGASTTRCG